MPSSQPGSPKGSSAAGGTRERPDSRSAWAWVHRLDEGDDGSSLRSDSPTTFLTEAQARFPTAGASDSRPASPQQRDARRRDLRAALTEQFPDILERAPSPSRPESPTILSPPHPLILAQNAAAGRNAAQLDKKLKDFKDVRKSNIGTLGVVTMVQMGGRLKHLAEDAREVVREKAGNRRTPKDPNWNPADFDGSVTRSQSAITETLLMHKNFSPGKQVENLPGMDEQKTTDYDAAFLQRIWKYKYVRKIEEPLPPLKKSMSMSDIGSSVPSLNGSLGTFPSIVSMDEWTREAKLNKLYMQKIKRNNRTREAQAYVMHMFEEQRALADFVQEKKVASPRDGPKKPGLKERLDARDGNWLTYICAVSLLSAFNDALKIAHTDTNQLIAMVREQKRREKMATPPGDAARRKSSVSRKSTAKSRDGSLAKQSLKAAWKQSLTATVSFNAMLGGKPSLDLLKNAKGFEKIYTLAALEEDENVNRVAPYIQVFFMARVTIKRRRNAAALMLKMMQGWATCGQIVMSARLFYFRVRLVQSWWRKYRDLNYEFNARIQKRWTSAELALCTETFEKENRKKKKRQSTAPVVHGKQRSSVGLSDAERIKLMLTPTDVANEFIAQEIRVCRFKHLAKLAEHTILYAQYVIDVKEWHDEKEAAATIGNEWKDEEHPMPEMPYYPTLRISNEAIQEMMKRCRADPEDVSVIETSQMMRKKRATRFESQRQEMDRLDSMSTKLKAIEKLSARDFLPRIPHPEGPDAPLMSM